MCCRLTILCLFFVCFVFWASLGIFVTFRTNYSDECLSNKLSFISWRQGYALCFYIATFVLIAWCQCIPSCMLSRSKRRFVRLNDSQNTTGNTANAQEMQDIQPTSTVGAPLALTPSSGSNASVHSSGSNELDKVELREKDAESENAMSGVGEVGVVVPPRNFLPPVISVAEADESNTPSTTSRPATLDESFDWNSFWMLLYGVIFYLGYDASLRGTFAYGVEDANRNASTYNTCMDPAMVKDNQSLGTDVAYKLSPPLVAAWMLFFNLLFVTVRRKRDPWLLSSYFNFRAPSQHGWGEKLGLSFLLLQCLRFSLDVLLNGSSTVKQVFSSAITISLAMMVFFFTLHVLQADIHRENKSLFRNKTELPHNYMWCVFCLVMYWSCGFFMYINNGGASQSETLISGFASDSIGMVTLYLMLHSAVWILFILTSWLRKDRIFGKVEA